MSRKLGYATLAILRAIADGADYGLDIMERTELPSGTVYPTLSRLEKRGYVGSRWERDSRARAEARPRRRYYRLTGAGEAALGEAMRAYGELLGRRLAEGGAMGEAGAARPEEA